MTDIWFTIPSVVIWVLWRARNEILFNQVQPNGKKSANLSISSWIIGLL